MRVIQNQHQNFNQKLLYIIYSIIPLFLITVLLISTPVHAQDLPTSVIIKPSLSLTIPTSAVALTLNPATTPFASQSIDITVGTNNPTGYWLTMSSTGANNTSLVNTIDDNKTIPTLTSPSSEVSFPVNKWGYKIGADTTDYLPYTSGMIIGSSSGRVNNDTTTLTLASKIDYLTTPGDYKQTFNIQALPNITQYYMQDIKNYEIPASQICNEQAPTIVIDKRDEQAYMIQRLPDHKCWMLDNLNLDLTNRAIAESLTTENTNASTEALNYLLNGGGTTTNKWAVNGLTFVDWTTSAGSYVDPLVNTRGDCKTTSLYPCTYNGTYTDNTLLSAVASNASFGLGSNKIGVFYNYCTATAGSYCYGGSSAGAEDPIYDICPANWRLPTGDINGDFYNLCSATNNSPCNTGTNAQTQMYAINKTSMQYQLSASLFGHYFGNREGAWRQGAYGTFYSSTHDKDGVNGKIRMLETSLWNVAPMIVNDATHGRSVRCLLQE